MGYGRLFFCSCLLSGRAGVLLLLGSSGVPRSFWLLLFLKPEEPRSQKE